MGNGRQNLISLRLHQVQLVQQASFNAKGAYILIFLKEVLLTYKYHKGKHTVYQSSICWFKHCPNNNQNL